LQETKNLLDKYNEESIGKTNGIAYLASMKLLKKEITKVEALELKGRNGSMQGASAHGLKGTNLFIGLNPQTKPIKKLYAF
jgi:hypothetical protein